MLAEQIRSGLSETTHDGAIAIVDRDGSLVASHGDIDRVFYLRSSAKPFQALVSQESGAGLTPLELAITCASHRGFPAHAALVSSVLATGGLDETALQCPPAWPLGQEAARLVQRVNAGGPRRIWNNCSGKHAGFLRACVASDWPTETYLDPGHPLQERVMATVSELGGFAVDPVGVDGCGAPVLRTTARVMATLFARLGTEQRLAEVLTAMHRYPSLIGANGEGDSEMAIAANAVAKGGAAGCVGVAVENRLGLAVKCWDGDGLVAHQAAATTLRMLGVLSSTARSALDPVLDPPVLGGGRRVGTFQTRFELDVR
ncbi:MAG: asparaginase [Acidimicrobiia bacterium]